MKNQKTISFIKANIKGKKHQVFLLSLIQVFLGIATVSFAFLLRFVIGALEEKDYSSFLVYFFVMMGIAIFLKQSSIQKSLTPPLVSATPLSR